MHHPLGGVVVVVVVVLWGRERGVIALLV